MGIDTKLYINKDKYKAKDILDIIKRNVRELYGEQKLNLQYESGGNYFTINYVEIIGGNTKNRMLSIFLDINYIGLPSHCLSLGASGDAVHFLKKIGKNLGGVFTENDCEKEYLVFQDPFAENEDFMLKKIQIRGKENEQEYVKKLMDMSK